MPNTKKQAPPINSKKSSAKGVQATLSFPSHDDKDVIASNAENKLRPNLFDHLGADPDTNIFCNIKDLSNESSVEAFFINRLLETLGYSDSQIKTKTSIDELAVPLGHSKINYKPDYVLVIRNKPRVVIDAKAPSEPLDKWVEQCSGYSLLLNQQYSDENPVKYFVLTNGVMTRLYAWDLGTPLI